MLLNLEKAIYIKRLSLKVVRNYEKKMNFSRIYFGSEFCENLIPDSSEIKKFLGLFQDKRFNLSFLTPWVTDRGLKKLEDIFKILPKGTEIVFNDWGTFNLINKFNRGGSKNFKRVLGRLLVFHYRDPRVIATKNGKLKDDLQNSNLNAENFQKFLQVNKISRVELDNTYQGYNFKIYKGLKTSLYYPFVFMATATNCAYKKNFDLPDCSFGCKKGFFKVYFPKYNIYTYDQGNSQFYVNNKIPSSKSLKLWGVNRLVFFPEIP